MGWKRLWISIEESTSDELRESMEIFSAGMRIRNELLKYKNKWKFSGSLTSTFEKPLQLSFLLQTILFGKHALNRLMNPPPSFPFPISA